MTTPATPEPTAQIAIRTPSGWQGVACPISLVNYNLRRLEVTPSCDFPCHHEIVEHDTYLADRYYDLPLAQQDAEAPTRAVEYAIYRQSSAITSYDLP